LTEGSAPLYRRGTWGVPSPFLRIFIDRPALCRRHFAPQSGQFVRKTGFALALSLPCAAVLGWQNFPPGQIVFLSAFSSFPRDRRSAVIRPATSSRWPPGEPEVPSSLFPSEIAPSRSPRPRCVEIRFVVYRPGARRAR